MNMTTETDLGETFIANDMSQIGLALALTREEAMVVDAALVFALYNGVLAGYTSKGIAIGVSDRLEALGYFTEDDAAELLDEPVSYVDEPVPYAGDDEFEDYFPDEDDEDENDPDAPEDDETLAHLYAFLESFFSGEDEDGEDDPEDKSGGYCDCEVCQDDPGEDDEDDPDDDEGTWTLPPIMVNPVNNPALAHAWLWDAYFGSGR